MGLSAYGQAQTDSSALNQTVNKLGIYTASHPTENIYLHLNKPWYARADTIWFKAYLTIGGKHQLSVLSEVIYAELVSPNDSVLQRLALKPQAGTASGDFTLPLTLAPGLYRVRAYTNWMKNEGEKSFYDRPIQIGNPAPAVVTKTNANKKPTITAIATSTATATTGLPPDVRFFPEGGTLVNSLRNVVAFKATNPDGSAVVFTGCIKSSDGETVADMASGYNGMGEFAFAPQEGKSYVAQLQLSNGSTPTIGLPQAAAEGYALTVNNRGTDTLLVKIAANPALFKSEMGKSFSLIAQSCGRVCYTTSGKLDENAFTVKISKNHFPTGIARLTLFSADGEPMNERAVFIRQPDNLDLKAAIGKSTYMAGEKTSIQLIAQTFTGQPVIGSFSAAVINEDKTPSDEAAEPTILSQLLLSSELHGRINDPGHYFADQTEKTNADLDLLMLTQGYRKLEWKEILDTMRRMPAYLAEDGLTISGTVKTQSGKPLTNAKVSLISTKLLIKADTLTDANGRFSFTGLDVADKVNFILKAQNGKSSDIKITLDQPEQTIGPLPYQTTGERADTTLEQALKKSYTDEELQYLKAKGRLLKEVKISGKQAVKQQDITSSRNLNGPGNADQVVYGKDMANKGCPNLATCLATMLANVSVDIRNPDAQVVDISRGYASILGAQPGMTVFIDGTIGHLNEVNVNDIYSVEALTSAKFKAIYGHDAAGGLLLITTKRGIPANEQIPVERAPGLINFVFKGYYKARTFYAPKYDANDVLNQPSAIYWKPDILTDKDGKYNLEYTNGGKGNYRVVIEGIDGEGRLGRAVYRYVVE
jgi:hypothetical protein